MLKRLGLLAVLILCAATAYALPDVSYDVWYYDEDGNVVGWYSLTCSGGRYSGGTTSDIYETFSMPCIGIIEPIMCNENEMPGCDGWCYSDGYMMGYNHDVVPNCAGRCICGEFEPCWKLGPLCQASGKALGTDLFLRRAALSRPIFRFLPPKQRCLKN